MVFNGNTIFILGVITWLSMLTIFVGRMVGHYNRLTHGDTKKGLKELLDEILSAGEKASTRIEVLEKLLHEVKSDGEFHIQKIGLVRFNPFSDTGGSQSFTLALLDGGQNGVVMTSLYGRTGNRWYIKEVRRGKGKELELSKEEESAISRAHIIAQYHT